MKDLVRVQSRGEFTQGGYNSTWWIMKTLNQKRKKKKKKREEKKIEKKEKKKNLHKHTHVTTQ